MEIKYLIMDVDGTLTDGKIYISACGELFKAFNVKDGYGLKNLLMSHGVTPIIITGRKSDILEIRCRELDILDLHQGISDKANTLIEILASKGGQLKECAYIGDDLNDLPCMFLIKDAGGVVACPSDANKQVLSLADFISSRAGGDGAVREFIEFLIEKKLVLSPI